MRAKALVALKQLEFLIVEQALRLPKVVAAPLREAQRVPEGRGYSGRDHALEEKSRTLCADSALRNLRVTFASNGIRE